MNAARGSATKSAHSLARSETCAAVFRQTRAKTILLIQAKRCFGSLAIMRSPVLLLAALTACGLSSGCVAAAVAGAATVGSFALQDRTLGEGIDDTTASTEVKSRLLAADSNGFMQVDVEVAEGNLLLSGSAPTEEHKRTAEMIAHSVRSVHTVYNEIVVGPRRGLGRNANDELISAQIRTRLIASPSVRAINVNIETFDGNVYLMGLARTDQELQRAAEIASTTPGVRRVVSFMQVRARGLPTYAQAPPTPDYRAATPEPVADASKAPTLGQTSY